jgi:transposase
LGCFAHQNLIPFNQMPQLSQYQRQRTVIKELWYNNVKKPQKIIDITGYPKSTVYDIIKKLQETGSASPRPRPGRPKVLTPRKRRHLGKMIASNNAISASEMTARLQEQHPTLSVSTRTVQRTVSEDLQYVVCRPIPVPLLRQVHIEARLNWAFAHRRDKWNQTIFSDETTFQLFRNTQLVRYRRGESRPHRAMVKHPYKVHLWGAFSASGPVGFFLFTGTMDAKRYCEILQSHLLPNASDVGRQWRFQQDNAPVHTAKATLRFLNQIMFPFLIGHSTKSN